jgi:acetyl-CoA carboxylase biotin carboxyl carrier protein
MAKKATRQASEDAPARVPAGGDAPPGSRKIGQSMDIESIRELVQLMVANDLGELDICDSEVEIHLKRGGTAPGGSLPAIQTAGAPYPVHPPTVLEPPKPPPAETKEDLLEIKSPMVGTFYTAPSPDSDPFVSVGSAVSEDTVVCIVEAMKVMNEVQAECAGTLAEICVQNAQPVEYAQVLFRVKKA